MRILMINVVCGIRSTGRICTDLAKALEGQGHEVKIAYGRDTVPEQFQKYAIRIGTDLDVKLHGLIARLLDGAGFGSKRATKKFIEWIKVWNPDVIHLHNIHGYYINIKVMYEYLQHSGKQIVWSFYDCWSFTGHCSHFDFNNCQEWQHNCEKCRFKLVYPKSLVSNSVSNFKKKKMLFTGIPNLHIVVPSMWMRSLVNQSYMSDYVTHVMPNGIDTSKFHFVKNDFRIKNDIKPDQCMVLGVSSFWTTEKGLEYFIKLSQRLPVKKYRIVIVGNTNDAVNLPSRMLNIKSTNNINELCKIYSAADIFINPTLQETQGLTTLESFACETPAIVFDTGGAPECVDDTCGIVVKKGDIDALTAAVQSIGDGNKTFIGEDCRRTAEKYDVVNLYKPIIQLYKELLKNVKSEQIECKGGVND